MARDAAQWSPASPASLGQWGVQGQEAGLEVQPKGYKVRGLSGPGAQALAAWKREPRAGRVRSGFKSWLRHLPATRPWETYL